MQPISLSTSQEVSLDSFSEIDPSVDTKKIVNPLFEKLRTLSPFDNLIDMNIVNFIFSFFDYRHFSSLRLLNKTFRGFADSPEYYSPYQSKLKTLFIDYNKKQTELTNKQTELTIKNTEITAEETELENAKALLINQRKQLINQLAERSDNWFGYFVSLITFEPGCFSGITEIFSRIFPSIKEEIETRNGLALQISGLSTQIRGLESFNLGDQTDLRNQLVAERSKLHEESSNLKYQISNVKTDQEILINKEAILQEFIYPLFGGKRQYEALPLLELNEANRRGDYIDYVKPKEMSAPIMRGIDSHGRNFFTIRFGDKNGKHLRCQTFFERYSNENTWVDAGSELVRFYSCFINNGLINEEHNKQTLEELKAGIKNMQLKGYFIQ